MGELNLYCDRQGERSLIQAALAIGAVAGLMIVNIISDNKGKKTALIVTQCTAILGTGRTLPNIKSTYWELNTSWCRF